MKRLSYLLLTLLTLVGWSSGAWAQTETTSPRVSTGDTHYQYTMRCVATDHSQYIGLVDGNINGRSAENVAAKFELETADGGYYIKCVSVSPALYMNVANTNSGTAVTFGDKSTVWTITGDGDKCKVCPVGATTYLNNNVTSGTCLRLWNNYGGCSQWKFYEYEETWKLSDAIAGVDNLASKELSVDDGGNSTISTDASGNILIHNESISTRSTGDATRPVTTVSFRINLSTPSSFEKIFTLSTTNVAANTSIGVGVTTERKLEGTWQGNEYSSLKSGVISAGSHVITVVVGQSDNSYGTRIYVDGSSSYYSAGGLKTSNTDYKYVIIDAASKAKIDAFYVFNTALSAADIATVTSNIRTIPAASMPTHTVTFNVYDGTDESKLLYTAENVSQTLDSAPVLPGLPTFVTATYDVATITSETTIVKAYTVASLPFTVGSECSMTIRDDYNIFADGGIVKSMSTSPTPSTANNYNWTVVGDWYNGFKFYIDSESNGIHYNVANDDNLTATVGEPTLLLLETKNDVWCLKLKGTNNVYMNKRDDQLGVWNNERALGEIGSKVIFGAPITCREYALYSSGMPQGAVVTIFGNEYNSLNDQAGNNAICPEGRMTVDQVSVSMGRGYGYTVNVDNRNYQIRVDFYEMFLPATVADVTNITDEEKLAATTYLLMDKKSVFVKNDGDNIRNTEIKRNGDKFIFVETGDNTGLYYIYNVTAGAYYYYTNVSSSADASETSFSVVRFASSLSDVPASPAGATWRVVMESAAGSVDIFPATGNTQSWNFRGGSNYALNLYNYGDGNASWTIIDSSAGSLACAKLVFSEPGAQFMHKLVPDGDATVVDVDFSNITAAGGDFTLKERTVGNAYKYVSGIAPSTKGEYTYTVNFSDDTHATVKLVVDDFLQSPTPMMGWLTWNWFARAIGHQQMVDIAQGLQDKGLAEVGFKTIVLDDCWATNQSNKALLAYDPVKFPSGISGLKAAVRQINPEFKIGIYSDAGSMTCENYQPGSYGVESDHVALFDSYGIDMLKYDRCNAQGDTYEAYAQMGEAIRELNETRRANGGVPFVYNACEWGRNKPWTWGAEAGASSWRATEDVRELWNGNNSRPGVLYASDKTRNRWMYAGVNRFNDLDMMCIGLHGLGGPSNNTGDHGNNGVLSNPLNDAQARSQMSIWCMFASPLSLTADVRPTPAAAVNTTAGVLPNPLITPADLATLTNKDIISINQDPLGQQAEYMESLSHNDAIETNYDGAYTVYVKDMVDGKMALAIVNRGGAAISSGVTIALDQIYLSGSAHYACKNVWAGTVETITGSVATGEIAPYETKVYLLEEGYGYTVAVEGTTSEIAGIVYKGKTYHAGDMIVTDEEITDGNVATLLTAVDVDGMPVSLSKNAQGKLVALYSDDVTIPTDGKVYAIYSYCTDGSYPVITRNGAPYVSTNVDDTPQLFIFHNSGTTDTKGTTTNPIYWNLLKADGDGKYANFAGPSGAKPTYSTTAGNVLFLSNENTEYNTSALTDGYYYLVAGGSTQNYACYAGGVAASNNNWGWYSNKAHNGLQQLGPVAHGDYTTWFSIVPQPYTVYTLHIEGPGAVTYDNVADAAITRASQTDGGFFVIHNDVTPEKSMFTASDALITSFSVEGTTINITTVTPNFYYTDAAPSFVRLRNTRSGKYLTYAGDSQQMTQTAKADLDANSIFYFTEVPTDGLEGGDRTVNINSVMANKKMANYNSFTLNGTTYHVYPNDPGYVVSQTYHGGSCLNDYANQGQVVANEGSWNDGGNHWMLEFVSVDEIPVDALATSVKTAAEHGIAPVENTPFAYNETAVRPLITALETLLADENATNLQKWQAYAALNNFVRNGANYNTLQPGRYLIRNIGLLPTAQGGYNDTQAFLTSLSNPMCVVEDFVTYYSIWDVNRNEDGTYTLQNEGNRDVMTPMTERLYMSTDAGYLHYTTGHTNRYQVGNANGTNAQRNLRLVPGVELFADAPAGYCAITGSYANSGLSNAANYYMFLDIIGGGARVESGQTNKDHNVKSGVYSSPAVGKQCLWQFIPLNTEDITDEFGTHLGEVSMFQRLVDELNGFVGGVVTLNGVDAVPVLKAINDYTADAKAEILAHGKDATLKNIENGEEDVVGGGKLYREIIIHVNGINMNKNTKPYYQKLDDVHPFFLENMCGTRPSFLSRLSQNGTQWKTVANASVDDKTAAGKFYATPSIYQYEVHDYYSADEARQHNAGLTGALNTTDALTDDQIALVNTALHLEGEAALSKHGVVTEEQAVAYNATLNGAIAADSELADDEELLGNINAVLGLTGDAVLVAGATISAEQAATYNATLTGHIAAGTYGQTTIDAVNAAISSSITTSLILTEAQATQYNETLAGAWIAGAIKSTETITTECYVMKNESGVYLKRNGRDINTTNNANEGVKFIIENVIPGIYQIRDVTTNATDKNNPYLTIDDSYKLTTYDKSEISTLWRFKTHNTFVVETSQPELTADEITQWGGDEFTTYSNALNSRVNQDEHMKPYYCTDARFQGTHLMVTLKPVPLHSDGYHYLQGCEGYLVVGQSAFADSRSDEPFQFTTADIKPEGEYADFYVAPENLLEPVLSTLLITEENKRDYYALQYNRTNPNFTQWHGQDISSVGLGFYHLKEGRKIAAGKAYLPASVFDTCMKDFEEYYDGLNGETPQSIKQSLIDSDVPWMLELLDENGDVTRVLEVGADGSLTDVVYDLQGRRVEKPGKGVYVVGGKKVMFK